MANQIDEKIKKERVKTIISLSNELENLYYQKYVGKVLSVLIENGDEGLTDNYIKVKLKNLYENGSVHNIIVKKVDNLDVYGEEFIAGC